MFFLNFQYFFFIIVGDSFAGKNFAPIKIIFICKMYKVSLDSKNEDEKKCLLEKQTYQGSAGANAKDI